PRAAGGERLRRPVSVDHGGPRQDLAGIPALRQVPAVAGLFAPDPRPGAVAAGLVRPPPLLLHGPVRLQPAAGVRPCAAALLPTSLFAVSWPPVPVGVPRLGAVCLPARSAPLLGGPGRAVSVGLRLRPRGRLRSLGPRRRPDVPPLPLVLPPQGTPPRLVAQL